MAKLSGSHGTGGTLVGRDIGQRYRGVTPVDVWYVGIVVGSLMQF
jgi:hypothetical protein